MGSDSIDSKLLRLPIPAPGIRLDPPLQSVIGDKPRLPKSLRYQSRNVLKSARLRYLKEISPPYLFNSPHLPPPMPTLTPIPGAARFNARGELRRAF